MGETPTSTDLVGALRVTGLDQGAAMSYLLNAIAHEINNHLTNLILAADSLEYGGGPELVRMIQNHVRHIADITRAVQRLGQDNLRRGAPASSWENVLGDLQAWLGATVGSALDVRLDPGVPSLEWPAAVTAALMALGTRAAAAHGDGAAVVEERDAPRFAGVVTADTVRMLAVELRWGAPPEAPTPHFKELVDSFLAAERGADEVVLMATWEVVRKRRGRMVVRGGVSADDPGLAVEILLPLGGAPGGGA